MDEQSNTKNILLLVLLLFLFFIVSMCVGQYHLNLFDALEDLAAYAKGTTDHLSTEAFDFPVQ